MCGGSRARTGNYNDGCDPEHVVEFVTVSSDFYPELRAYYTEEAKVWPARLEGWATVTTRPCCRIACPTWHRRVPKLYPRPPLPVPLVAAGSAASRLASVIARSRRSQGTVLAGVRSRGIVWRADVATICCLLSRLRRAVHARVAPRDALRPVRYVRGGALCGEWVDPRRPARRR